ncbi:hypothetical protein [Metaclostridioides mangenotii]|uniref:Y-family DNA polymerase n=1 Tax=Metaclostridioides mangenotii TaxID=1540 RepID=UPI00068F00A4|nr:hypothetical protein [Clostridioides mangenotii]
MNNFYSSLECLYNPSLRDKPLAVGSQGDSQYGYILAKNSTGEAIWEAKRNDPKPMWINIVAPNIKETYDKAMKQNCKEIQPITEMKEMGLINAMFEDPFHYIWMLHQIEREVSFEERCEILEEKFEENDN